MACFNEQQIEIPCSEWYLQHAIRVAETGQTGSQFWMNADYALNEYTEPSLAVKAAYSDAQYAYNQIPALIAYLGITPQQVVNPAVQQILTQQQASTAQVNGGNSTALTMPDLSGVSSWLSANWQILAGGLLFVVVILPMITGSLSGRGSRA